MISVLMSAIPAVISASWFVDVLALSASCGVAILCKYLFTFRG